MPTKYDSSQGAMNNYHFFLNIIVCLNQSKSQSTQVSIVEFFLYSKRKSVIGCNYTLAKSSRKKRLKNFDFFLFIRNVFVTM